MVPLAVLALAVAIGDQVDMPALASGAADGRTAIHEVSSLQALIDAAAPGGTVDVAPGTYIGGIIIDKPIRLIGHARPLIVAADDGTAIRIRANDVTLEGIDIDGRGSGDLGHDPSGIHVAARRATIRDCRIANTLFGIYLREADAATVERCTIRGIRGKDAGEKGSGIHVWNTNGFVLAGNDLADVRDGFYIQSSFNGRVLGNTARDLRYGIHYMFSDDNTFEDNLFENGAAGAALMYSKRIAFRRNRILHNRGFASVGLLFKACDDVVAEDNLIGDNARGIFLEGSYRNVFRRNIVAESDAAIVLYDSSGGNRLEGNSFVSNLTPLSLVGRRTDTVFHGNYWSDNDEPDLDGDGRSDRPYRLSSVFDHLRSNLTAADLFTQGLTAAAVGMAERAFPVLDPIPVVDEAPLAHPPTLDDVPHPTPRAREFNMRGIGVALLMIVIAVGQMGHAGRQ